jgi:membrane AbrB-like protein
MSHAALPANPLVTLKTLVIGGLGAAAAFGLSAPAAVLVGPALAVSLSALAGMRLGLSNLVRDICLVAMGLGVGSGFDPQASAALMRWPFAFIVLAIMLFVILHVGRAVLERGFGFDRQSAILAAAPGHLSFVLGIAAEQDRDMGRIAVVQSIRLLALTLAVPFIALAMGYEMRSVTFSDGPAMAWPNLLALSVVGVGVGLVFRRLSLPAPLLLGAMVVSALGHVSGITPGMVPQEVMTPAFLVLGTLIGTRFAGMQFTVFRASLGAGLAITGIAVVLAVLAALPVALALAMPAAHVVAGFAPGGLETMIALSAAMGASPGFVAACHVMRLLFLSVLIPITLQRAHS